MIKVPIPIGFPQLFENIENDLIRKRIDCGWLRRDWNESQFAPLLGSVTL